MLPSKVDSELSCGCRHVSGPEEPGGHCSKVREGMEDLIKMEQWSMAGLISQSPSVNLGAA